MSNEVVVYFANSRMARIPKDKLKIVHLGQRIDEEYTPDTAGGAAVVNWDQVCLIRDYIPKEEDLNDPM